jgi:hypothetical protein
VSDVGPSHHTDDSLTDDELIRVALHGRVLESFLHHYTQYLRTFLDFEVVAVIDGSSAPPSADDTATNRQSTTRPSVQVGKRSIELNPTRVFLKKVVDDIVLVLQLNFDGIFVCANLYAPGIWPLRAKAFRCNSIESIQMHPQSSRDVFYAGTMVQGALQLQSFVYDFHLFHARAELLAPPGDPRGDDLATCDLLGLFRMLTQHHTGIPRGARSEMRQHDAVLELGGGGLPCTPVELVCGRADPPVP